MHITYTLGEVRILGTVLLWVYSGTFLPISIEIAHISQTWRKRKVGKFSFLDTRCISATLGVSILCTTERHNLSGKYQDVAVQ